MPAWITYLEKRFMAAMHYSGLCRLHDFFFITDYCDFSDASAAFDSFIGIAKRDEIQNACTCMISLSSRGNYPNFKITNRFHYNYDRFFEKANRFFIKANRFFIKANRFFIKANRFFEKANRLSYISNWLYLNMEI